MKSKKANTLKKRQKAGKGIKGLMKGIIMQAIADLWTAEETDECIKFFSGDGFRICANIVGMNLHDQVKLLDLVRRIVDPEAAGRAGRRRSEKEILSAVMSGSSHGKLPPAVMAHGLKGVCSL